MSDEDVHDLAAAYAVDAVDDVERARVERHLPTCAACRDEIRTLQETSAVLAASTAVSAPPRLKAAVLETVSRTPQVAQQEEPASTSEAASRATPARSARQSRLLLVAASVLAIAAVTLGALFVRAAQQRDDLSTELTAVQQVLTAPDAQTVSGDVGDGRGSVVTSESLRRAVFVGSGLDAPPSGETYQLWVIDANGVPTSAGTFEPGDDGSITRVMQAAPVSGDTVGLSVEPDGGSDAPTTTPILAVPLA